MIDPVPPTGGVHLVGSIPLESASAVFELTSAVLGPFLRRIPDGETGERRGWIRWQYAVMQRMPIFQLPLPPEWPLPRFKLREGIGADSIVFGELGYSASALASYAEFSRLRQAGVISRACRFQVCLPTPLAVVHYLISPEHQAILEPVYEAKLLAELDEIVRAIPAEDLAIQWDTAVEFALLEGVLPTYYDDTRAAVIERLIKLGGRVPDGIELGYHLCYGDADHKHFKEPEDSSLLVSIANAVIDGVERPIDWIHLPVPRDRKDDAYFAPLAELRLPPETELYLGILHLADGVEGARERIQAAQKAVPAFGAATECGFGRRPPETIPELIRLHAQVAQLLPRRT